MILPRRALLGALLVAVTVSALSTSSAEAEPTSRWLVLKAGKLLTDAEIESNKERFVGAIENGTVSLLATILSIPLELLCTKAELIDALLGKEGSVKSGALAKFTGCVALNAMTKAKLANCNAKSEGQPAGTVVTKDTHALLTLHELLDGTRHDTLLILPDTGAEIAVVEMGEGCATGEVIPISGTLSVWDCVSNEEWLLYKTVHLITAFKPLTGLKAAGQIATIDGSMNVSLAVNEQFQSKL